MLIKVLVENTAVSDSFQTEHGLSLYIEANGHKLLFDMGRGELFLQNAAKLDVDIEKVEFAALSHGHHDHGGGMEAFLRENSKAPIYLHQRAMDKHYSVRPDGGMNEISIDEALVHSGRLVFTSDRYEIAPGLELFCNVTGREHFSKANKTLFMEKDGEQAEDTFEHEQNLIITEGNIVALFAGCAHNGIINILRRMEEIGYRAPDYVFGGFHLFNPTHKKSEAPELIRSVGEYLSKTPSVYYTGHCTGQEAYSQLQGMMGDRIRYMATGSVIEI